MKDDSVIIKEAFNSACDKLSLPLEIKNFLAKRQPTKTTQDTNLKDSEIACLQLIELYQSLYNHTSGDHSLIQHLLNTNNTKLNAIPIELLQKPDGIDTLIDYYGSLKM